MKINELNSRLNKFYSVNTKIHFFPNDYEVNQLLKSLKEFGKVSDKEYKYSFRECPNNIKENRKYEISGEYNNIFTKTGPDTYAGTICSNDLDKSIEEHK